MIGLMGAMDEEIALLKDNVENLQSMEIAKMEYYTGNLMGQDIVLLKSGIGKVNATICAQILIDRFNVSQIIFTGLAGTLVPYLTVGDIVVSNYVVQYDFDLTAFGRRHGELPDVGRMIEADSSLLKLTCYAFDSVFKYIKGSPKLVVGTIISGDKFVTDPQKVEWLQREFGAVATEMEGAAVGYTCFLNDIPFVIIRTISDSGSDTAIDDFNSYLKDASKNSYKIISNLLEVMTHKDIALSDNDS